MAAQNKREKISRNIKQAAVPTAKTDIINLWETIEKLAMRAKKGSREGENLFVLSFGILGEDVSMMDEAG
jgi:hypothetical protein